jgi:hypothetical protein
MSYARPAVIVRRATTSCYEVADNLLEPELLGGRRRSGGGGNELPEAGNDLLEASHELLFVVKNVVASWLGLF